jgi:microcystin-dependent protein
MTEEQFKDAMKANKVDVAEPAAQAKRDTPGDGQPTLAEFLPLLVALRTVQQPLSAAPTSAPQTFQDQIQFVFDGSACYLYLWISNAWQQVPIGGNDPAGTIKGYGGPSAPAGYLLCDGSAVSRTTYSALFAAIGTAFGIGDGSTTFNVPDLRGRVLAGYKGGDTNFGTLGASLGEAAHTLTTPEIPAHTHDVTVQGANGGSFANTYFKLDNNHTSDTTYTSTSVGGGGAHNNIQPSVVGNWIIKA